jgi:hypothetical protein
MKLRACCLAALMILLAASAAQAGWVMQQQTPGGAATMYVQDNMMRTGSGERGIIYDLNQGTVTMLNPSRKVYWSGRPEQLNKQMKQALDARLEQALKNAPPGRRKQMRAMMAQRMGRGGPMGKPGPAPRVEVKATGDYQKIAGYKTRKYQVYVNGRLRQEVWIADAAGFTKELDMGKMAKLIHAMRMAGPGAGSGTGWRASPPMMELMAKGMPLMITAYGPDGAHQAMKMTKVEKKSLGKSIFQPPPGYKRVNFRQMMR